MDLENIKKLISQGESEILEFKTSTSKLKNTFQTICGFLNNKGGIVLIGVANDGKIIGQDITDNTKLEISTEVKKIEPHANIDLQYIKLPNEKSIIYINVMRGLHAPYVYDGRPFQRNQSQTNKMTQHRYEQLLVLRASQDYSWEKLSVDKKYNIDDLDENEIIKTINDGVNNNRIPAGAIRQDINKILQTLELIEGGKVKNAAIALFGKNIKTDYRRMHLKLGRFQGKTMIDELSDNQQYYCNAFQILEHVSVFMKKHLNVASQYDPNTLKRIDKPTLPVLAVREAIINAVCHRDYIDPH